MAKKLTQVWKTFFGAFFETEEEALRAEKRRRISDAVSAAWSKTLKAQKEKEAQHRKELELRDLPYSGSRESSSPFIYSQPTGFIDELIAQLDAENLIAEPTTK